MNCFYCEREISPDSPGELMQTRDHIIPISRHGKKNAPDNIVPACRRCNELKGNKGLGTFKRAATEFAFTNKTFAGLLPTVLKNITALQEKIAPYVHELYEGGAAIEIKRPRRIRKPLKAEPYNFEEVGFREKQEYLALKSCQPKEEAPTPKKASMKIASKLLAQILKVTQELNPEDSPKKTGFALKDRKLFGWDETSTDPVRVVVYLTWSEELKDWLMKFEDVTPTGFNPEYAIRP